MSPNPSPAAPRDRLDRPMRDLRISVTDRCNFRCTYCMPKSHFGPGFEFMPRRQLLSFEEITRVARVLVGEGIRKIRLTGGEPLLRAQLPKLVAMLAELGVEVTLTSNGSLLKKHALAMKDAGLDRVTVSLDSLDDNTFRAMNDADYAVSSVLEGIDAAAMAGLTPIKVNSVVRRGVNDAGIVELARYFKGTGHILRFIEFMDVGATNGWKMDEVVSGKEIVERIHAELPLEPLDASYRGEVAKRWRYADGSGEIGIITSVTQPFCGDCTRLRLSADGTLYTCLFAMRGTPLREALREGHSDDALRDLIHGAWRVREDRYSELRSSRTANLPKIEMSYIGG